MKTKTLSLTAVLAFLFIATTSFAEARHCRRSTHFGVSFNQVAVAQPLCYDSYVVERYPVYQAPVCAPVVAAPQPQHCCEQQVVAYPVRPVYYQEAIVVSRPLVQVVPSIGFGFGWSWFR